MSKESENVMRSQRRKKQHAVDVFGGECCMCGYNKCVEALEFHHLDKNEKEESPSTAILRWSFERAKKELDKCILVCANCHREIHAANKEQKPLDLQQYYKPWLKKTCECCSNTFETKLENQKYCSSSCFGLSQRKATRPTKEVLEELIKTNTWVQLGRMFKVSDNAVRKWAKKYELL